MIHRKLTDSAANTDSDDEHVCHGNDHTSTHSTGTSLVEALKGTSIDSEVECTESDAKQIEMLCQLSQCRKMNQKFLQCLTIMHEAVNAWTLVTIINFW